MALDGSRDFQVFNYPIWVTPQVASPPQVARLFCVECGFGSLRLPNPHSTPNGLRTAVGREELRRREYLSSYWVVDWAVGGCPIHHPQHSLRTIRGNEEAGRDLSSYSLFSVLLQETFYAHQCLFKLIVGRTISSTQITSTSSTKCRADRL